MVLSINQNQDPDYSSVLPSMVVTGQIFIILISTPCVYQPASVGRINDHPCMAQSQLRYLKHVAAIDHAQLHAGLMRIMGSEMI